MLLSFALFSSFWATAAGVTSSAELKEQLLAAYDRDKWPGWSATAPQPTVVSVQYYINSLWGIDQKKQQFTAEVYFRAWWTDERLAYNASLMGEVQFDQDVKRLWLPDFYWPNSRGMHHDESLLEVYPSGGIWWSQRKRITFTCPMYFHNLPYDTQSCFMTVSTYADKASQAQLEWRYLDNVADGLQLVNNNEWDIGDAAKGTKKVVEYAGGIKYDELYAQISFKRQSGSGAIWPCVLFVAISYCGFWINPAAAPGRITLAVICVLIVLTNLLSEMSGYPQISYAVWLRSFMTGCLIFNLVAVFEYPVVNFGMTLRSKLEAEKKSIKEGPSLDELVNSEAPETPAPEPLYKRLREPLAKQFCALDFYFRGLFPLSFLIFAIAMAIWEPPHPDS